jgi:chorismate--pyruvate lyase
MRSSCRGEPGSWLLDEGSLTARLQAASGNRLRVRVLNQQWQRPRTSERRALGLRAHEVALVREVVLECAGEPWVFARSILPATTLRGRLRHLRRFGERSLGALLFSTRGLRRAPFELARIDVAHRILPAALAGAAPVWGGARCSTCTAHRCWLRSSSCRPAGWARYNPCALRE